MGASLWTGSKPMCRRNTMADYERCLQGRSNCVFWAKGNCLALLDTHFTRACPFYKPSGRDYRSDITHKNFPGETFRWIRGIGGNYLISRDGKLINSHGERINPIIDYRGRLVAKLQFNRHYIQIGIADLIEETYGKEE